MKLDDEAGEDQLRQWDVHLGVEWSASPDSNFVGTWKMKQSRGQLDNVATFNRGATSRDSHYTLTLAQSFIFQISPEIHRLRNRMHVTLPSRGIDLEFAINHLHSNFIMDSFFLARYAPRILYHQCVLILMDCYFGLLSRLRKGNPVRIAASERARSAVASQRGVQFNSSLAVAHRDQRQTSRNCQRHVQSIHLLGSPTSYK